jgi:peptidoglycan/LPS O-acetylase OafA/YrhL
MTNRVVKLDWLRALAILSVLAFHFFEGWLPGGWMGVDIFFVLSGYLACHFISKNDDIKRFLVRRIFRIWFPMICFISLALPLLSLVFLHSDYLGKLLKPSFAATVGASNFYFFLTENYFDNGLRQPLLHLWSLGIEIQFYIIFAMGIYILRKIKNPYFVFLMLFGSVFLLFFSISSQSNLEKFYFPQLRLLEFGVGCIAYMAEPFFIKKSKWLFLMSLILIILYMIFLPFGFSQSVAIVCFLAFLSISVGDISYTHLNPIIESIALRSYALYLVHYPISFFAKILFPVGSLEYVCLFFLAILLGCFFYRYFDRFIVERDITTVFRSIRIKLAILFSLLIAVIMLAQAYKADSSIHFKNTPDLEKFEPIGMGPNFLNRNAGIGLNVIIIGDSHLNHVAQFFESGRIKVNKLIRIDAPCLPIPNTNYIYEVTEFKQKNQKCTQSHEALLASIDQADIVILAARWSYPLMGPESENVKNLWTRQALLIDDNKMPPYDLDLSVSHAVFEKRFLEFLDLLKGKNKSVVIFGEVPPLGADVANCNSTIFSQMGLCNNEFYSYDEVQKLIGYSRSFFISLSTPKLGVHYFDTQSLFCSASLNACKKIFNNSFLYRDSNHLDLANPASRNAYFSLALDDFLKFFSNVQSQHMVNQHESN